MGDGGESEWDSATSLRSNLRGKFKEPLRRLKWTRVNRGRGRKLGTACLSFRQRCQPGSSSRLSSDSPEAGKGAICRANEASDQAVVLPRLHCDDRGKRIDQLENNREEYCGEASYLPANADGTNPNSRLLERCGNREETANCSLVNQIVGCHDSPILHGSSGSRGPGEEKINGIRQQNNKWVVEMRVAGKEKQHLLGFKRIWLGTYYTWDEAVRARDVGVFYCGKEPRRYFSPAYIPFLPSLETLSVSREPEKISASIKALAAKNSTKPDLGTSGAPPCSHLCHSCAAAQVLQPQTISHTAHGLASLHQAQTEGFKHFQDVDQDRRAAGVIPQDQLVQAQRDMEQAQRAACAIPQDLEHVQRNMQDQARRAAYASPQDLDHAQRAMFPTPQQAFPNAKELDQYQNPLYGQRGNAQTLEGEAQDLDQLALTNVLPEATTEEEDCGYGWDVVDHVLRHMSCSASDQNIGDQCRNFVDDFVLDHWAQWEDKRNGWELGLLDPCETAKFEMGNSCQYCQFASGSVVGALMNQVQKEDHASNCIVPLAPPISDSTAAYNNVDGSNCVIPHIVAQISDCTTAYNNAQKEAHGQSFWDHVFESDQMENGTEDCRLSPGLLETDWTTDLVQGLDQMQCFSPLWDELNEPDLEQAYIKWISNQ